MNKKMFKVLKIAVVLVIIIALALSFIVSQSEYHLATCNEEHCIFCALIHIVQNIISLSFAFIVAVVIVVFIYFFLSRLRKAQFLLVSTSLVFQKVQLNE